MKYLIILLLSGCATTQNLQYQPENVDKLSNGIEIASAVTNPLTIPETSGAFTVIGVVYQKIMYHINN